MYKETTIQTKRKLIGENVLRAVSFMQLFGVFGAEHSLKVIFKELVNIQI